MNTDRVFGKSTKIEETSLRFTGAGALRSAVTRIRRDRCVCTTSPHRLGQESRNILGGFGLNTRFLQKTEIAEPVDIPVLPRPERNAAAGRQSARHTAAVRQSVAGMPSITVEVHFDI